MVLNLHGLNGSPHNTTYKLLLGRYPEEMVVSPQIDYEKTSPVELVERLKWYKGIDFIVGNSLGGFYAYILGNICHVPCLLVNPCIPPERYIPSLVEGYKFTDELAYLMEEYFYNRQEVYMVLGMGDDVLSPVYTEQVMDVTKVWKIDGGHSLSGNEEFYSVFYEALGNFK